MSLICKPFVLVRHGETPLNLAQRIGGRSDVPLTARGEEQARAASALLMRQRWSCIAVSPLLRARRTAELALPGQPVTLVDDLRERDWGDMEGMPIASQPPYEQTPPNGESWQAFCDRVTSALNLLLTVHDTPLLVAHSGIFRVINLYATGTPYGERMGNVVPMWILPGLRAGEWEIVPLEECYVV